MTLTYLTLADQVTGVDIDGPDKDVPKTADMDIDGPTFTDVKRCSNIVRSITVHPYYLDVGVRSVIVHSCYCGPSMSGPVFSAPHNCRVFSRIWNMRGVNQPLGSLPFSPFPLHPLSPLIFPTPLSQ